MKRLLAIYGFVYGSLGSICAVIFYILAIRGELVVPDQPKVITTAIATNIATWILALYNPIGEAPWRPVLRVTPILIKIAKVALGAVLALVGVTFVYFRWERHQNAASIDQPALAFLLSAALLQFVYLTIYWAVRPENIFPPSWIRRWSLANPYLVGAYRRIGLSRTRANRRAAKKIRQRP